MHRASLIVTPGQLALFDVRPLVEEEAEHRAPVLWIVRVRDDDRPDDAAPVAAVQ